MCNIHILCKGTVCSWLHRTKQVFINQRCRRSKRGAEREPSKGHQHEAGRRAWGREAEPARTVLLNISWLSSRSRQRPVGPPQPGASFSFPPRQADLAQTPSPRPTACAPVTYGEHNPLRLVWALVFFVSPGVRTESTESHRVSNFSCRSTPADRGRASGRSPRLRPS